MILLILRKFKIKQYIAFVLVFLDLLFLFKFNIYDITVGKQLSFYTASTFSKIPFGNVIYNYINTSAYVNSIYQHLFTAYFITTLIFSVVWGIILPLCLKNAELKKIYILSSIILIPIELLFMFLAYSGISYFQKTTVFDFGCFILLAAGIFFGWHIYKYIFNKKSKTEVLK